MKMNQRRQRRARFVDQSDRRFAEQTERAFAADEELGKIEAASCKPIGQTEEVVAATVLADRRTFLRDQCGVVL